MQRKGFATVLILVILTIVVAVGIFLFLKKNRGFGPYPISDPTINMTQLPELTRPIAESSPQDPQVAKYLSVWKSEFKKLNNISDQDFDSHVVITATDIWNNTYYKTDYLHVSYVVKIDWLRVSMSDYLLYAENGRDLSSQEIDDQVVKDAARLTTKAIFRGDMMVHRINVLTNIASQSTIRKTAESSGFGFDINRDVDLDGEGNFVLRVYGVVDKSANQCKEGSIVLETGGLKDVRDAACIIVN
jgi:hypothetical protein